MQPDKLVIDIPQPILFKGIKYCPFCGKEMTKKIEFFEHYSSYEYYTCDCEDSIKYNEILNNIKNLTYQLPKQKYTIKTTTELCKII